MNICLIAPKNPESFWTFDRILPTLGRQCLIANLSIPTVAGLTPPEHEVRLIDENVEPIDFDTDADIIGLTGYVIHQTRLFEIAAEFRRRGKFLVAGGPFASLCPERLRDKVDVLFIDEAEYTWPQFLKDYADGTWRPEYRQDEKPSLHDSPIPRFDLLETGRYQSMTLQFTRGCPFTCEFCDIIVMYGRRPRSKRVAQVIAELDALHRLDVTRVLVVDDNFIGNKREAKALLTAIIEWQQAHDFSIDFCTEVSIDVSQDAELLRLLHDARFTGVFIGIESPRPESLRETTKHQNLRENLLDSVHRVQAAGIAVLAGMIVGFDHDDPAIFEEHLRFIQDARIPISMTGLLNAIPTTPLYRRLAETGRLANDSTGDQFFFTNIVPASMTADELYEGYTDLLERLYSYRHYRRRVMADLLHRGMAKPARGGPSRQDLLTLLRMMWTCILAASPRRAWLTVSILAETLVRRPGMVRDAATLALMHKHFYEFAREVSVRLRARAPVAAGAPPVGAPVS